MPPAKKKKGAAPFPSCLAQFLLLSVVSSSVFCQLSISWDDFPDTGSWDESGIATFAACLVIQYAGAAGAPLLALVVRRAFHLLNYSRAVLRARKRRCTAAFLLLAVVSFSFSCQWVIASDHGDRGSFDEAGITAFAAFLVLQHIAAASVNFLAAASAPLLATVVYRASFLLNYSRAVPRARKNGGAAPFLLMALLSFSFFCQQVIASDEDHSGSYDEAGIAAFAAFLVLQHTVSASVQLLAAVVHRASLVVHESEENDNTETAGPPSRKRKTRAAETEPRAVEEREDYWDSSYGKLLTRLRGMSVKNKRFKVLNKKFRRLFRLSLPMFEELLVDCKMWKNRNGQREADAFNRRACPIDLLLLGTLQVLAAGTFFHHLEWTTGCSTVTHQTFFWWFCYKFTDKKMAELITRPKGDDLERVMAEYALLGLPGCVGSIDVTHVGWANCPSRWQSWFTGKEGHPTLAYECVCDRQGLIRSATPSTPGSRNDKSICEVDDFVCCMREGMYGRDEVRYSLLDHNANAYDEFGGWLLCDGGYHRWRIFQCGRSSVLYGVNEAHAHFAKRVASVRKDIECTFGALKGRWRVLKGNLLYKDRASVDRMFYTCCCLHNWLILADPDTRFGWSGKGWHAEDGQHEHVYYDMPPHARYEYTSNPLSDLGGLSSYTSRMSKPSMSAAQSDREPGWKELGDRLAVNYTQGRRLDHYAWTNCCLTVRVGAYSRD